MAERGAGLAAADLRRSAARWPLLIVLGLAIALLILSRRPDAVLHAELWGDDGWSWYPDAYRIGAASLLIPANGYLNTVQRLVGLAVQPLPLTWVPTAFALAALAVQAAPPVFLLSRRMDRAWPSLAGRMALAALYAVLPGEVELYVNLTNSAWNLALLAFLVLAAEAPRSRWEAVLDTGVLLLSGLSGPFCFMLLPVAGWHVLRRRDGASVWRAGALLGCAATQAGMLLSSSHLGRSPAPLGAGPRTLARILAAQVFAVDEIGMHRLWLWYGRPEWQRNAPFLIAAGVLVAVLALAALRGSRLFRQFLLFATLVALGGLASPQVSLDQPQWALLTTPPMGQRYFTFLTIAWVAAVLTLLADRARAAQALGALLGIGLVGGGVAADWRQTPFPHTDFLERACRFEAAPAGTAMEFPLVPPGLNPMRLVKRPVKRPG